MARRLPPLTAVRAFEAAARLGSFTRAAEELAMTQSGISYQVRVLEDIVQGPLFTKRGRGVELTSLGQRLAPSLTLALDGIAKAFADAVAEDDHVLTVACSQVFGANWLAPRIGRFQLTHPGLAVRVMASDALADLEQGEADIAIRSASSAWPGLASDLLTRALIVPMAHPEFLKRHGHPATPDEVLKLPRTSADDLWWSTWHEQVSGKSYDDSGPASLRFDSQLLDGAAAMAGHGAAMLNPFMWQPQIEQGLLVPAFDRWAIARGAWFCCLPRRRDERKIRAFRKWIRQEIDETRAWLCRRFDQDVTLLTT